MLGYPLIYIVNAQLQTRFKEMHGVRAYFNGQLVDFQCVLFSANLIYKEENIIIYEASLLQSKTPDDISSEFPIQLLSYCTAMESEIKRTTTGSSFK